jgi:hypothetical protein
MGKSLFCLLFRWGVVEDGAHQRVPHHLFFTRRLGVSWQSRDLCFLFFVAFYFAKKLPF